MGKLHPDKKQVYTGKDPKMGGVGGKCHDSKGGKANNPKGNKGQPLD